MKYLKFRLEKREFPYGKLTPVWEYREHRLAYTPEQMFGMGVYPQKNVDMEALEILLETAFINLERPYEGDFHIEIPSPESVPSMDWSSVVEWASIIRSAIPAHSTGALAGWRKCMEFSILSYVNSHSALMNAGLRPDSGGMKMTCTYLPEELWQVIMDKGLVSKWMLETVKHREYVSNGGQMLWAI